jgi:hypothetical protein
VLVHLDPANGRKLGGDFVVLPLEFGEFGTHRL